MGSSPLVAAGAAVALAALLGAPKKLNSGVAVVAAPVAEELAEAAAPKEKTGPELLAAVGAGGEGST